jgi:alkanesulfonate monooxygenase SsuD/methylene tetrahydromethanopterin reductase-like flavin-dependent oxidoreductase (luciferase family)
MLHAVFIPTFDEFSDPRRVVDVAVAAEEAGWDGMFLWDHVLRWPGHAGPVGDTWTTLAAVAARTSRVRISTDIALLPFAHPIRLAEDMAILDQISGGRMELGIGLGYAPHEFRAFGIPRSRRVSLTEECVDVLKLAWTGEPFTYEGKRYQFDSPRVTPQPVQAGGPPLWMASTSPASVARAIDYDTNLLPQGPRSVVLDPWRSQMTAAGRDPSAYRIGIIRNVFVTDDRERDWPPLREGERYRMRVYGRFFEEAGLGGGAAFEEADRIPQRAIVGDVEHCVRELVAFITEYGLTDVVTWGSVPGVAPATLTPMMERFVHEVVPLVRERVNH